MKTKWVCENPKKLLVLSILATLLFLPPLAKLEQHFSARIWLRKNDPSIEVLNRFEEKFGNDESIVVLLKFKNSVFDLEAAKRLDDFTQKMWEVPFVLRAESLTNFYWTTADGDDIMTEPFLDSDRFLEEGYLQRQKKQALAHPLIPNYLVSEDTRYALVFGRLTAGDQRVDHDLVYKKTRELVDKMEDDVLLEGLLSGSTAINHQFKNTSFHDLSVMLPIMFVFMIIYLAVFFRSMIGVVVPFTIIFASLIVGHGLMGLLGISINSMTMVLPSIVVAIGMADSVHLISSFYEFSRLGQTIKQAAHNSLVKNLRPIFLTSISTTIGFMGLSNSEIAPIADLGLVAGIATMVAFVFSVTMTIPMLILFSKKLDLKGVPQKRLLSEEMSSRIVAKLAHNKWRILTVTVASAFVSLLIAFENEVDSNPYRYFKPHTNITKANNTILNVFNGATGPEIFIDSGAVDGVKDPEFLGKVETFQKWLESKAYVNRVVGLVDVLKEVNQALHSGQEEYYALGKTRKEVAEHLFLYTLGPPEGMDIKNRVDLTNRYLRLSVLWSLQSSKKALEVFDVILDKAKEIGLNAELTGKATLFQRLNPYVVSTFLRSMLLAVTTITILLIIVFRSVKLGLLSLIPNLVPLFFAAGLLTLLGRTIDMGCAIVASVTLGIAVDDTIHFLCHYQNGLKNGSSINEAMTKVFMETGPALLATTIILIFGFGVFIFADLIPNVNFGILSAFVLALALLCDIIVLPAIVLKKTY